MMKDKSFLILTIRLLALLIVLALCAPISAEADFSDYKPSSLKAIGDMVKEQGREHEGGLELYTGKYIVRVRLSGYPTKIGNYASSVLDMMWRSYGLDRELRDIYKYELAVENEGHSFTLAFQEALIPHLKEEVKPGEDVDLYVLLGIYDIDAGKITMLVNEFATPSEAPEYVDEGNALYDKGDYEKALVAYEKAVELEPDNAEAWFNMGGVLGALDRQEESLKAFDKVVHLIPDDEMAVYNKGAVLMKLGRYKEALEAFEKTMELNPDLAAPVSYKGIALAKLGRYDKAIAAYDKALELYPNDATAWYNKACAYALLGDRENALKSLSTAIGMDSQYKEAARNDEDLKSLREDSYFKKLVE